MELKKVAFEPMNEIHFKEAEILKKLLEKIDKKMPLSKEYEEFLEDVKKHFKFEEELMQKYDFFAYIPHKMEHDKMLKELETLKSDLDNYDYLKQFFEEKFIPWLHNHIETIDTVTAGFLSLKGEKNGI